MKAVLFDKELKFITDYPMPVPFKNEALIRIALAGICNTDIEITKGYAGFKGILGHEFVGIVEKINGKDKRLLGKRVVGEINCGCGDCEYCLKGLKTHCLKRSVLGIFNKNGSMAEYIILPVENLLIVPENVSDEEAVFTEPLAAAFEIIEQVNIKPSDKTIIMGDGKLGLLASFVLKLKSKDVTLLGKHEGKLRIAKKHKIKTINLANLQPKRDYDIVVESTGNTDGFNMALNLIKPRGIIVLKSTVARPTKIDLTPVVVNEITVVGSRCGPFKPALDALSKKLIDVKPLITGIFPFERVKEAFNKTKERDSLKVIIDFR